ncbi:MAG: hypothetical protein UHY90_05455, partial [Treponema sp.]|nr:hypothetical protein [Treponema sp.]
PSRYVGGEFGITIKEHTEKDGMFNFAVAFPDMYEIAMSNLAVKIIYNGLNNLPGVRCERVFAPAPDFEDLLKKHNVPLYTLETGMALSDVDMIGFSIGYELGITEVLAMLEGGNVPALAEERKEGHPIVIAGGCGVTNPAPFSDFFDAFIIGEAEPVLFDLVKELSDMKKKQGHKKGTPCLHGNKKLCLDKKQMHRAGQNHSTPCRTERLWPGALRAVLVPPAFKQARSGPWSNRNNARMPKRMPFLPCRHILQANPRKKHKAHNRRNRPPGF